MNDGSGYSGQQETKYTKCTMSDREVKFWARKVIEHFHMLGVFIIKSSDELSEAGYDVDDLLDTALDFEQQWQDVYDFDEGDDDVESEGSVAEYLLDNHPDLFEKTLNFKQWARKVFTDSGVACIPALAEHMIGETLYYRDCILGGDASLEDYEMNEVARAFAGLGVMPENRQRDEWNYAREFAFWATEHAESLEFTNCELPQLADIGQVLVSKAGPWAKIMATNEVLAAQFRSIAERVERAVANGASVDTVPQSLYHEMMATKKEHLKGLVEFAAHVDSLPFDDPDDRVNVLELNRHEGEEAMFAFARLGG